MQNPLKQSEAEVEEHNHTPLPYRSWCRHCVRGRGKEMLHCKLEDEAGMPEVHSGLCFLGDEADPAVTVPVFVMREWLTGVTLAAAVPSKSTNSHIARRIVAFRREIGVAHGDLLVRTDQEPAIRSIVEEVGQVRAAEGGGLYVIEQSPVGSSASNGLLERATLSVEQQEDRWSVKVGARHSVVPWLVEYAAVLLNGVQVGKDGRTAFERCKVRKARTLGIEFGEGVLWKRKPIGGALVKVSCMWDDGVYLGLRGPSGELIVSDVTRVWRTRTVQRKAAQDRWRPENVELVRWVPWAAKEDDPKIDGERFCVHRFPACWLVTSSRH